LGVWTRSIGPFRGAHSSIRPRNNDGGNETFLFGRSLNRGLFGRRNFVDNDDPAPPVLGPDERRDLDRNFGDRNDYYLGDDYDDDDDAPFFFGRAPELPLRSSSRTSSRFAFFIPTTVAVLAMIPMIAGISIFSKLTDLTIGLALVLILAIVTMTTFRACSRPPI
jgi:hypothetical protein